MTLLMAAIIPSKKAKGSPEVSTASKNLMMNFLNKT